MKKKLIITFAAALLALMAFSSVAMAADDGPYARELTGGESYRYTTARDKITTGSYALNRNTEAIRTEGPTVASSISGRVMLHGTSTAVTSYVSVSSGGTARMYYYTGYGDTTSNYNLKLYNPHTYGVWSSGRWAPDNF